MRFPRRRSIGYMCLFEQISIDLHGRIKRFEMEHQTERLYLVSDIGRPRAKLKSKYGDRIDFQTGFPESANDEDPWWYQQPSTSEEEEGASLSGQP